MKHSKLTAFVLLMASTALLIACDDTQSDTSSTGNSTEVGQKQSSLEFTVDPNTSTGGTQSSSSEQSDSTDSTSSGDLIKHYRKLRQLGNDVDLTGEASSDATDSQSNSTGDLSRDTEETSSKPTEDSHCDSNEGSEISADGHHRLGDLSRDADGESDEDAQSDEDEGKSRERDRIRQRNQRRVSEHQRHNHDSDHESDEDSDHESDEDSDHESDEGSSGSLDSGSTSGGNLSSGSTQCVAVANSTQTLYAGQHIDAGTLNVRVDGDDLVLTYQTQFGWEILETHLWVGSSLTTLPTTTRGNPQVGLFPYKASFDAPTTTYAVRIALSDLGFACPSDPATYQVAAHASVRLPKGDGTYQQETAWANGTRLVESGSWATAFSFDTSCECEVIPPPTPVEQTCETAFAYSEQAACFLDLDLNQDGRRDFSRWGWTLGPISEGSYQYDIYGAAGQCNLGNGTLVGTLDVTYASGSVTLSYRSLPGFNFSQAHGYAGADVLPKDRNGNYTVAPGQYTTVESLADGTTAHTTVISGLSGPVYVVSHSVACGSNWN
jgi:hypothetical protein